MKRAHVLSGIDRVGDYDGILKGRRVGLRDLSMMLGFDYEEVD